MRIIPLALLAALFVSSSCECTPDGSEGEGEGQQVGEGEGEGSEGEGEGEGEGGNLDAGIPPVIDEPDPEDPNNAIQDADCDGISDEDEFGDVWPGGGRTDPADWDTDGDGIADGVEAGHTEGIDQRCPFSTLDGDATTTTNPTIGDSDADCIPDGDEDNNTNGRVDAGETDPANEDSDGDGLTDGEEDDGGGVAANACNGVVDGGESDPTANDSDGDGLSDGLEALLGTDPNNPDSDGDGVDDGTEYENGEDPTLAPLDTDQDGILDADEIARGLDPNDPDFDNDGLCDGPRTVQGICILGEDLDRDGILDPGESDPQSADTDCDGLSDRDEVSLTTDPLDDDSDGDGLADGLETGAVTSPDVTCAFSGDADPLTTTDPTLRDSDGDGKNDGVEDLDRDGALAAANLGGPQETDATEPDTDGDGFCDGGVSIGGCVTGEDRNGDTLTGPGETDPRVPDLDLDLDGLTDALELLAGTDPGDPDSDADGLCDGPGTVGGVCISGEDLNGNGVFDPGESDPNEPDSDCDAVADAAERANVPPLDPLDNDSDNDGLRDGVELSRTTTVAGSSCVGVLLDSVDSSAATASNPALADSDSDGLNDGVEDRNRDGAIAAAGVSPRETFPNDADSDNDGRCDGAVLVQNVCIAGEDLNGNGLVEAGETDPRVAELDTDADGLLSTIEALLGTSDNDPDSDNDGLCDGAIAVGAICIAGEDLNRNGVVNVNETSPTTNDTDCDAISDSAEPGLGLNPLDQDSDNDLLADGLEIGRTTRLDCVTAPIDTNGATTTLPLDADTDNDGINDGTEDRDRDGALDAAVVNPLTTIQETDPNDADTDNDGRCDGAIAVVAAACVAGEDFNKNGIVDGGESNPRAANQDLDNDGLDDADEGPLYGTSPADPDSDNDGLLDGEEVLLLLTDPLRADTDCDGLNDGDEDALGTDPFAADSDGDGLSDGLEAGTTCTAGGANPETDAACNVAPAQCVADGDGGATTTDPDDADSDGDGVDDGAEDTNQDGTVDPGELNPGDPGDVGGADADACAQVNLRPVSLVDAPGPDGDVTLAVAPTFTESAINVAGVQVGVLVFDSARQVAGAAFKATAPGGSPSVTLATLETNVIRTVGTVLPGSESTQTFTTWEGYDGVFGEYLWDDAGGADVVTAALLALVTGARPGAVSAPAFAGGTDTRRFVLNVEVVDRGGESFIVLGLAAQSRVSADQRALFSLDDLTNGSALAAFGDDVGVQCDRFDTAAAQIVDFVLVIDNSGSMGNEQNAVAAAVTEIGARLSTSTVDWRIAVITTDNDAITNHASMWATCDHPQTANKGTFSASLITDGAAGANPITITTTANHDYVAGDVFLLTGANTGGGTPRTYNATYTVASTPAANQIVTVEADPGNDNNADLSNAGTVSQPCAPTDTTAFAPGAAGGVGQVTAQTAHCTFTNDTAVLSACIDDLAVDGSGAENPFRSLACAFGRTVTGTGITSEAGNMCGRNQQRAPYAGAALYGAAPAGFVMLPRDDANPTRLRENAQLAVIFITDTNEQSDGRFNPAAVGGADPVGTLDSVATWEDAFFNDYDGANSAAFVAGIVCPAGAFCSDDNTNTRFQTFFGDMGGVERALPPDLVCSGDNNLVCAVDTDCSAGGFGTCVANPNQNTLIQNAITAILSSAIATASPYVLSKPPISSTFKVATDSPVINPAGCESACETACVAEGVALATCQARCVCDAGGCTEIPRSSSNGFDYDGTTNSIQLFGACRVTAVGERLAISYRYWIEDLVDAEDCTCPAPYQCVNQQCLCPADCGGGLQAGETCDPATCTPICLPDCGGCAGNEVCDTGLCDCACEPGCGGAAPGPGFVCDDGVGGSCEWECLDCGGAPPGLSTCNTTTCAYECTGCGAGDPPAGQFCNTNPNVCDFDCLPDCGGCPGAATCLTGSCTCDCPADCGGTPPSANHSCDQTTCTFTCATPPVGSTPPRADYTWDAIACDWVCPPDCGDAVSPGPNAVCDTGSCEFFCPADCGGCDGSSVCNVSECRCECPGNCGTPQPSADFFCNGTCAWECSATPTTPSPGPGYDWDVTSCAWECASDCNVGTIDAAHFCNLGTCAVECRADCGGCGPSEVCDTAACACTCDQPASCAAGFAFDPASCQCVCDAAAANCPITHDLNPDTCTCECSEDASGVPDCGGCPAGSLCQTSLCECRPLGG